MAAKEAEDVLLELRRLVDSLLKGNRAVSQEETDKLTVVIKKVLEVGSSRRSTGDLGEPRRWLFMGNQCSLGFNKGLRRVLYSLCLVGEVFGGFLGGYGC